MPSDEEITMSWIGERYGKEMVERVKKHLSDKGLKNPDVDDILWGLYDVELDMAKPALEALRRISRIPCDSRRPRRKVPMVG